MKKIYLGSSILMSELASKLGVSPGRVIQVGFEQLGFLLTVTEALAFERAKAVAEEFGFTVERA